MTLNSSGSLAVVELVIYVPLFPASIYLLLKHGRHGLFGHAYLIAFIVLRLAAAGLTIGASISRTTSTTAAIMDSVGLSPLLLSLAGFLHEVHFYVYQRRMGKLAGWFLNSDRDSKCAQSARNWVHTTPAGLACTGWLRFEPVSLCDAAIPKSGYVSSSTVNVHNGCGRLHWSSHHLFNHLCFLQLIINQPCDGYNSDQNGLCLSGPTFECTTTSCWGIYFKTSCFFGASQRTVSFARL